MNKSELRELVKQVIKEENDYQQLFKHMLDKSGKSISSMSDDDKKKFFNAVDTAYKAKSEGRLTGYNEAELTDKQKQIDVDKDGEIEGSDLAALRAKNETELTDKQKQIDVDKDGEIEGSDLAKLRSKNEVGTNDWHFKAIMKMYDMAGSYGKKKISAATTSSTNSSKRDIERALRDTDYDEITDISDKLGIKEVFSRIAQKKKVNENLAIGVLSTLAGIIIGKIVFYYIVDLAEKGIKYFQGKSEYKNEVKEILDSISKNKKTISDISKMIDPKTGIDNTTVNRIVELPYVRTQIIKTSDSTNGKLSETELENALKTILLKSWADSSITDKAVEKVKKDLK